MLVFCDAGSLFPQSEADDEARLKQWNPVIQIKSYVSVLRVQDPMM